MPNYAGNIIVNLASLPDFLRRPILKKRMIEFFDMEQDEKDEIIRNALEAGPGIPFHSFAKLFGTWLEILASFSEERREAIFSGYAAEAARDPQSIIEFNLDGMLGVYLSLGEAERESIAKSAAKALSCLDAQSKRRMLIIVPDNIKAALGL